MKIYTKTGDRGETSIIGGKRLPKHHPRIEAYGTIDELIAWIGLLRSCDQKCVAADELVSIQSELMSCAAIIATEPGVQTPGNISVSGTEDLEKSIDRMEKNLPALTSFVLPGGSPNASYCNIARCVCRRAERAVLRLNESEIAAMSVIQYLNRLSDYLFVLSRCLLYESGKEEIRWIPGKK